MVIGKMVKKKEKEQLLGLIDNSNFNFLNKLFI